jgi:nucleotide-binding universal stress UspA family protein
MQGLASIVVGLDFSDCSKAAIAHAQRVASWAGAQVHPVHVVDTLIDEIREDAALTAMQRGIHASLIADARKRWDSFVEGIPEASRLNLEVSVARRLVGIRHQLDRHSADLLVLGAYGDERPKVGMGTLASACVRSVQTDALIVRDTYRDPFRTVVAGIDGHGSGLQHDVVEAMSVLPFPYSDQIAVRSRHLSSPHQPWRLTPSAGPTTRLPRAITLASSCSTIWWAV